MSKGVTITTLTTFDWFLKVLHCEPVAYCEKTVLIRLSSIIFTPKDTDAKLSEPDTK